MTSPRDCIGRPVEALATPALLIEADVLEHNLAAMRDCVAGRPVAYRPHTKSHKSPVLAKMQIAAGARGVCCAKLGEAEVMVAGGVIDVHVTTPVAGPDKARRLASIACSGRLSVVADDASNVAELAGAAQAAGATIDVVIEVDVGQGRCGVQGPEHALGVAEAIARAGSLRFKGLQGYQGKLQSIVAAAARRDAVRAALDRLLQVRDALERQGMACAVLTGGGTGSLPIDLELAGLNELQPGSYVFMDSTYRQIDWTRPSEHTPFGNALTVLAGVVSRPLADRAVLDVGWKAASSDSGAPVLKGADVAIEFAGDEHSLVQGTPARTLKVGSKVELIPSHCDTTVNLYDFFHVIRGGVVEDVWPVAARGRSD
jgi:D-serine deaminase-like pyridoxal phosphate-dependent protein